MATNCPYGLRALATVVFDIDAGQRLDALHPPDCGLSAAAQASLAHLALPHSTSQDEGDTQFAVRFHESTEPSSTFLYGFVLFRQQRDESRSRGYFQKALVLVSERPYVDLYDRVLRVAGPLFFSVGAQVLRAVYDGIHSWPAPTFGVPTVLPLAGTFVTCIIPQLIDYGDLDAAFDAEPLPSPPSSDHFIVESDEQSLSDDPASEEDEDDSSGEGKPQRSAAESTRAGESNGAHADAGGAAHAPSPSFGDLLISRRAHQVSVFESVGLYSSFVGLESSLWLLWQLAITGESLVVLSPHARTCSQATLAFTSLIAPLQFQGDYRPYYTLYESDFDELVRRQNRSVSRPSEMTVIGTTNPFFLKSLNRWPNALVFPFVEATQAKESSPGPPAGAASAVTATTSSDSENRECVSLRIKKKVDLDVFEPSARARILRRCSAFVVPDATVLRQLVCQQEVYLTQTASVLEDPHTAINNAILRKVELRRALARSLGTCVETELTESLASSFFVSLLLHQHFRKLTKRFLEPFEQYFGIWKANGVRPNLYMSAADFMKPFELQSFLASVNPRKLPRQIRASKWKALYTGFVQSPHFEPWFTYRRARCVRHFATTMRSVRAGISASMLLRSACGKELSREQCKQLQVEIESALAMERMREPVDEEQMRVIEGHLKAVRKRLKPKKARKSK